eukprot:2189442-Pyramimonas_sp.AAC.1
MICDEMLCEVALCCAMLCYAMLCSTMLKLSEATRKDEIGNAKLRRRCWGNRGADPGVTARAFSTARPL